MKFCLFAPFSGGVKDICGRQVPIIHSTGLLAPPAGVYVGNRFIFMFMLTPSVFVSNRFIVYVDVQFTKSAHSYGFIMGSWSGKCNNQEGCKQHAFNILSKSTHSNQFNSNQDTKTPRHAEDALHPIEHPSHGITRLLLDFGLEGGCKLWESGG